MEHTYTSNQNTHKHKVINKRFFLKMIILEIVFYLYVNIYNQNIRHFLFSGMIPTKFPFRTTVIAEIFISCLG